ncbi:MAG TPA: SIMPL domain-containing protein, partial [Methanomicrobiales archaeon]|nr:SIMPL domain-containing protein [Methanomicrobiales archaeon]
GMGEIKTSPDKVTLSIGVETRGTNVQTAQQQNAQAMTKVIDALVAYGIPNASIKTSGYAVYPEYDYTLKTPKIIQYRVSNMVTVETGRVSETGAIIDLAVANGATNVNSVIFGVSDAKQQELRSDAIKAAMQKARADAEAAASAAGLTISGVDDITISSGYSPYYPPMYSLDSTRAAGESVPTPIQPGEVTVTASVTVTYLA